MAKREFLQLAHNFNVKKHRIIGWFLSEKLDGMRVMWDGGISRGMLKSHVPWANTDKDSRYNNPPIATGLWSRYGNVIHAPDWWLDKLPAAILDGELYSHLGRQTLMSTCKKLVPDSESWRDLEYYVFDMIPVERVFEKGRINNTNFKKYISQTGVDDILHGKKFEKVALWYDGFDDRLEKLYELESSDIWHVHPQNKILTLDDVSNELERISLEGGEGLIARDPHAQWLAERTHLMVKMKKLDDMEGTVVGYTTGRRTELGSKLLGLMGALIVRLPNGRDLELSGFTDAERELVGEQPSDDGNPYAAQSWAESNPGKRCPDWMTAKHFPIGQTITFKYRGLTNDGIPNEARYWRQA